MDSVQFKFCAMNEEALVSADGLSARNQDLDKYAEVRGSKAISYGDGCTLEFEITECGTFHFGLITLPNGVEPTQENLYTTACHILWVGEGFLHADDYETEYGSVNLHNHELGEEKFRKKGQAIVIPERTAIKYLVFTNTHYR